MTSELPTTVVVRHSVAPAPAHEPAIIEEEVPLFHLEGAAPAKAPRKVKEVARTDTGESAADIIAAWVTWISRCTDTNPPKSIIARIGKQVKVLIESHYTTQQIKVGLSIWTVEFMGNPRLSVALVDNYVWKYALDTSARARAWRTAALLRVQQFSGQHTAKQERRAATVAAAARGVEGWEHQ